MTATQTPAGRVIGDAARPAGFHREHLTFEEQMNLPGATLDNVVDPDVIGAYGLEYDGPRCAADGCRTPVADDDELCDDCRQVDEEPRPYPCPTCSGNGCPACGDTGELVEWTR